MMTTCPRWQQCNAPICPLDPHWQRRVMANDDPVCFYVSEAVKDGAKANFDWRGLGNLFVLVSEHIPAMSSRWGRLRRALERASKSGSRLARPAPWEVQHG